MISKYINTKWLLLLFFGQLLSLCLTITNTSASALWQHYEISIPYTQSAIVYFLQALLHGIWHHSTNSKPADPHYQDQKTAPRTAKRPLYIFFLVILFSILDVQVTSLSIMAFKNTSVLSALIIASWNLPCTMLLSTLFLYARYRPVHFAAVSLCLAGVACSIWSDTMGTDSAANHTWVGDLLCFISASVYGISIVVAEYLVRHIDIHDFLYRVGVAGCLHSSVMVYVFEWGTLTSITWTRNSVALVLAYALSMVFMNSVAPIIYRMAGATFASMNVMTCSFYSLLIAILFLNAKMPPLYPVAYLLVVAGATTYNLAKAPTFQGKNEPELQSPDEHQPLLHRESPNSDQKQPLPNSQQYLV
ncbi:hypothetical protein [Absidia glauca]|uniref:EamA domain-containing protein n=1 Tax=Absidia glauca TaxID=4829 RepID=A0A168RX68_ABSGL|nr:hypothetical protein [Absidia glauca]